MQSRHHSIADYVDNTDGKSDLAMCERRDLTSEVIP